MEAHAESTIFLIPITQFKTSTYYTYPNDNTVTRTQPSGTVSSGCSQVTYSTTWLAFSVSSSDELCSGSMDSIGLGEPYGGGLWTGSVEGSRIAIEPVIEDHSTSGTHTNPDSTLYIHLWFANDDPVVSCQNGKKNCQ